MKRLTKMGIIFMKSSKMLTFSAFLSIFVACFLSISMFQLSSNVESSMEAQMEAKKGKFDIRVTKDEGKSFDSEEIESLEQDKDVKGTSRGYQTNELLDTYMVGVVDDDINKSLYKYTKDVKEDSIIINDSLARRENKKVGDTFFVDEKKWQIIEVVKTDSRSDYKMPMAIMELSQIHKLLGQRDTEQVNYMLLQCEDSAYENIEYGGGIVNRIIKLHPDFYVSDQREGEDYNTILKNIRMIFNIFFVVIIVVSGLFVASIFTEYMRKYKKDMAVIRTVGGEQKQVQTIFFSISVIISICACLAGALFSVLVSGVTLNWFNDKVQLFEGSASLNWKVIWQITITVFVLFNALIYVFFYFGQSVLPIQVFQDTSSGLKKSKKANRFLILRKILGKEGYLGIKLMSSKFRQNFMMILIIALITALSYSGQASLKPLLANDNWYNYNNVDGKTAKGEIWTDKPVALSYAKKIYKRFNSVMGSGYMIFGDFNMVSDEEFDSLLGGFSVSDLERLPQFLHTQIWEQYKKVPKTKRIVMEKSAAKKKGCKLGDTVILESDYLGGQRDFVLVEIVDAENLEHDMYDVVIDWDNLSGTGYSKKNLVSDYIGIWLEGDKELIRKEFQQLQIEPGIDFDGTIYDDVVEQSEHTALQWTTTLHIVLAMLLIVAGIGLLNSAKGMLLARKKDYQIIQMLGTTKSCVHRICWMQVWSYMFSGVVLGAILGIIVVHSIWQGNVFVSVPITVDWGYLAGIVIYLFGLSLILYPTIKKMG